MVLFVNACIVGGVVYVGVSTLLKRRPGKKTRWLVPLHSRRPEDPSAVPHGRHVLPDEMTTSRYLTISSVSLGLSVAGTLFYSPLGLVSVPLTVYGTLPVLERAVAALVTEGRLRTSTVQSVAVVVSLATRHYVVASLLTCLHDYFSLVAQRARHFNTIVWRSLEHDSRQILAHIYGARPHAVWVQAQGAEVEIPFEALRMGDVVVVSEGDLLPVEGTIVEGSAEVSLLLATGEARLVAKRVGDRVIRASMVVSGKMCLRVDRL
jgi:cation transport ATPase